MLGAEGVPKFENFGHETELSHLKLHEISVWFSSNVLIASWEYHPESTGLRNLKYLGCSEAVKFWENKRTWSKQDTYSDRKNHDNLNPTARTQAFIKICVMVKIF